MREVLRYNPVWSTVVVQTPMSNGALTTLDISLEPSSSPQLENSVAPGSVTQRSISLLRCVVLTRHLDRIIGAIERALTHKTLRGMQLTITESELEINGRPTVVLSLDSAAYFRRLRSAVLKAITPGTVVVDSSPSVSDFLSPCIGPIVMADLGGRQVAHTPLTVGAVGIYTVEGEKGRGTRTLLRRWTLPPELAAKG